MEAVHSGGDDAGFGLCRGGAELAGDQNRRSGFVRCGDGRENPRESTLVSGSDGDADAQTGAAVDESSVYTGSDYFASARLTRQQARDNAVALLQQAAEEDGAAQTAKDQASEGIQAMAQYTMAEAQIENLVTAKGYQDCVAFMSDDSISVVVSTDSGKLTDEDVAKITDIAKTETGYAASSIKIMAAN